MCSSDLLMGGEITLESHLGVGSSFTVRLPCRQAEPETAPESFTATSTAVWQRAPQLRGIRVLIAEDNAVNQMLLEGLLGDEGCILTLAEDGQRAVDRVRAAGRGGFDLVLMDIQMPVMNGLDAARAIHAIDPGLPIVGQTGHAFDEDREKSLRAGLVDQLNKPLDPDLLVDVVRRWARRSAT